MAEAYDILFETLPNETKEDLQILNGDFIVNKSDQMHIQHILKAYKGQYYQNPLIGLGIANYKGASLNPQELKQEIKLQLKSDNIRTTYLEVTNDFVINIDAERIK